MLAQVAQAPINHVLRGESWALKRLQPFAGRTAKFVVAPLEFSFTISATGEVAPSSPGAAADTTFRLSPGLALRILSGDRSADHEVAVEGDAELAQAIRFVVRNARWDLEEDLARIFGDAIAHRIAGGAQALLRLQSRAVHSVGRNLSDYLTEERGMIASRRDIEAFVRDVDALREEADRLAQRVALLEGRA